MSIWDIPPGGSYLGSPATAEQLAELEQRKLEIERLSLVVECWIDGYQKGEASLECVARGAWSAAKHFGVDARAEEIWVGRAVRLALMRPPAREGRRNGVPSSFKAAVPGLVELIRANENVTMRPPRLKGGHKGPGPLSVFERVVQIFHDAGFKRATARTVEKWYAEYHQNPE